MDHAWPELRPLHIPERIRCLREWGWTADQSDYWPYHLQQRSLRAPPNMIINDFFYAQWSSFQDLPRPEVDPLVESDALLEAQFIGMKVNGDVGRCGLIVDLRTALQIRRPNTAIIVADKVQEARWEMDPISAKTVWNIVASTTARGGSGYTFTAWTHPSGEVRVTARRLAYFGLSGQGLMDVPPDLSSDPEHVIRAGFADWESNVRVLDGSLVT